MMGWKCGMCCCTPCCCPPRPVSKIEDEWGNLIRIKQAFLSGIENVYLDGEGLPTMEITTKDGCCLNITVHQASIPTDTSSLEKTKHER
jgi:hypothetical protein